MPEQLNTGLPTSGVPEEKEVEAAVIEIKAELPEFKEAAIPRITGAELPVLEISPAPAPVTPEATGKTGSEPEGAALLERLEALERLLGHTVETINNNAVGFGKRFDEVVKRTAAYDTLCEEMVEYKKALLKGLHESLLKDLLSIYDLVEKQRDYIQDAPAERLEFIRTGVLEFLARQGIEPINTTEPVLDRQLHHAIKILPISDQSKDRHIERVLRAGFLRDKRVFRAEEVAVFKYEPPQA